jgi:putative hydrolase of the HAD superfamily
LSIQAISLDFWNTLFVESPGAFALYAARRQQLLGAAIRECGHFTDDQIDNACRAEAEAHYVVWRSEHRTLTAGQRLTRIIDMLDAQLPPERVDELARAYEEGILDRPPVLVDGARAALEEFSGKYKLGIISDVGFSPGRVLRRILADTGILPAFDSLVFSDEAGCSKPHLEVFKQTATRLGAEPECIAHIGDLEHTDIVGAKAAGYRAIRFAGVTPLGHGETTLADGLAIDWGEVPKMLEAF